MVIATGILFTTAILGPLLVGIRTGSFHLFWFRLYLPFYAVALGWFVWTKRSELRPLPAPVLLFAAFGIWVMLSVLWASEFNISWFFFVVSGLFVGAAVFLTAFGERTLVRYLLVVFALVAAGEAVALVEIFTGWHLPTSRLAGAFGPDEVRVGVDMASAWFNNRNNFAFLLSLASGPLFAITLRTGTRRLWRMLSLSGIGVAVFIMWAGGAWAALAATVIALGSVFVLTALRSRLRVQSWTPPKHGATILTALVFLAAIAAISVLWFVPNPIGATGSSFWARWQLGVAALDLFVKTNGLGVGIGAFPSAIAASAVNTSGVLAPHNWLLYLLGTFGIVGTALFLAAYSRLLYDLLTNAVDVGGWEHIGLFGTMLALPVAALGPSNALQTHTFWLFLGFAAVTAYASTNG